MLYFRAPALLTLAALSVALAAPLVPAGAQAPAPLMHGAAGAHSGQVPNPLGITSAQKAQMRPILMKAGQQYQALQANTALSPSARMAKIQALQKNIQMQMMALLTPAQRAKVQAMAKARMQSRASGHPSAGFGGPRP